MFIGKIMIELQGQIKSFSTAFIGIPKVYLNHIWYPIDAAIRAQSRSIPAWNEYIYFWKSTTTIIFYFLLVFFFFFFLHIARMESTNRVILIEIWLSDGVYRSIGETVRAISWWNCWWRYVSASIPCDSPCKSFVSSTTRRSGEAQSSAKKLDNREITRRRIHAQIPLEWFEGKLMCHILLTLLHVPSAL